MAIYHLNAKIISRGKGQSAIAAAAYRSGERLRDEQADEQKYYTSRAERIVFTDIMAPAHAPEWAHDRNQLWNAAERAEKRKDAQLAREFEISLPHELTERQREWLVKDFAREAFVRKGYAVDIAIHAPDKDSDHRNYHAHLMVTMREIGPEGFVGAKDRELNSKAQMGAWREQWANLANRHLERHGHAERIDHRSLKEQGVDREATIHLGYAASEIAARGGQSDRMDELRGIIERNEIRLDMRAIKEELKALEEAEAQRQKREAEALRQAAEAQRKAAADEAKRQADQQRRDVEERQRAAVDARNRENERRKVEVEDQQKAVAEETRQRAEQQQRDQQASARARAEAKQKADTEAARRQTEQNARDVEARQRAAAEERNRTKERRKVEAATEATRERQTAQRKEAERAKAEEAGCVRPAVPIEKIHVQHAAAEADRVRAQTARAAEQSAFQAGVTNANTGLSGLNADQPKAKESPRDKPGVIASLPELPTVLPKVSARDVGRAASRGYQVLDGATGKMSRLTDFVTNLLAGAAPRREVSQEFTMDPAQRRAQQLQSLADREAQTRAEKALERMAEDMQAGRGFKSEDIKSLTRQQQEQIRHFGDAAAMQMVEEAQRRAKEFWQGRERERD